MQAQGSELTVCRGTSTNGYVPVYGYYADAYLRMQMIYPADSLADMAGGSISQLTWFISSPADDSWGCSFVVKLANTTATTLSDFNNSDPTTTVYTGTLSGTGTTMSVTLNDGFEYSGDNLLVEIYSTTLGDYSSCYFHGCSATGKSIMAYSSYIYPITDLYDADDYETPNFLPTLKLTYTAGSSCARPRTVAVSDITNDGATLTWNSCASATSYIVTLDGDEFTTTDTTYTFSGLDLATTYTVSVRTLCGSDTSSARTTTFRTRAGDPLTLPLFCDFTSAQGWDFENGTQANQWFIDSALYISNDNGATNAYTINSTSYTYAYCTFVVDNPGAYTCTFDWKAQGESQYYDYLRAFIVPDNTLFTAGTLPGGLAGCYNFCNASINGWLAVDGGHSLNQHNTVQHQYSEFTLDSAANYKLVFVWANDASDGTQPPAMVDNIAIQELTCPQLAAIGSRNLTTTTADVFWTETGSASNWVVAYDTVDFIPGSGAGEIENASDTTITLTNLVPGHTYYVYVHADCGSGDTSYNSFVSFRLPNADPVSEFPYLCDFANGCSNGWELVNGSQTNKWAIGTAAAYGDTGDSALYISNDNGTSNAYSTSSTTNVYAYRDINFTEGQYNLQFNWRANGESTYDYLRVYLAPITVEFTPGTLYSGIGSTGTPTGWIALDGNSKLNLQSSWQTRNTTFDMTDGSYHLVFVWHNDASSGTPPPAAVDNIQLIKITCPAPTNFAATTIGLNSIDLVWHEMGEATSWVVEYDSVEFTPGDLSHNYENCSDESVTLTNLEANTTYYCYLYADCGGDVSLPVSFTARTLAAEPATLPYFCDFSDASTTGFELENGTQTNKWYINNGSLFISNTNGTTNAYSTSNLSYVYAYRIITIDDTGAFGCSFDWSAEGESASYDYLRAFLVPASETFTAGVLPNNASCYSFSTATPAGWIPLDGGHTLNQHSTLQNQFTEFHLSTPGTYKLTFIWANDASSGTQPPALVDNVQLSRITCPRPTNVEVTYVGSDTIELAWTETEATEYVVSYNDNELYSYTNSIVIDGLSPQTDYTFFIRGVCGSDDTSMASTISARTACGELVLPYSENFYFRTVGERVPCWNIISESTTYPVKVNNSTTYTNFNTPYLYLNAPTTIATPMTPIALNQVVIDFDYSFESTTSINTFYLGYTTSIGDAITYVDTVVAPTGYTNHSILSYSYNFALCGVEDPAYIVIMRQGSNNFLMAIDNVVLKEIPDCIGVSDIALTASDSNMLAISWTENGSATSWTVEYGPAGFIRGNGIIENVNTTSVTLNNLTPNTTYDIYISPDCSGVTDVRMVTFRTTNTTISMPFNCTFEDNDINALWILENGTNTNKWYIGSAINNGGSHSLYISDDNGATNDYTNTISALDYAYVDCMISQPGDYAYSYDWRCNGESSFDYIRVALVPASENLTAATSTPSGFSSTSLPASWIALDGGQKLNLMTSWQNVTDMVSIPTPGVYHLVFAWRNDASAGTTPPAAIDNIQLTRMTCPRPINATAYNITADSIYLSWSATGEESNWLVECDSVQYMVTDTSFAIGGLTPNSDYTVRISSLCGSEDTSLAIVLNCHTTCTAMTVPYSENFDNITTSTTSATGVFVDCWNYIMTGTSTYTTGSYLPQVYYSSSNAHSGSYSLRLYGVGYTMLPPMSESLDQLQLSFWDYSSSSSYGLEVGVMEGSTFVPIETIPTLSSAHGQYTVYFANYTGSSRIIAFRNYYTTSTTTYYSYHYIDNIEVDYAPTCMPTTNLHTTANTTSTITLDWTDLGTPTAWEIAYDLTPNPTANSTIVTSHPATLTGLASTPYYFRVRPICSATDTGEWSTDILCQPGSWNMRANQTDTVSMCGGVIYDDGGMNGNYSMSQNSYLVVMPDAPGHAVSLSGTAYIEGNTYDNLYIYDGIGTSGTALVSLAGSSFSSGATISATAENASGALTIYFKSDASLAYSGFALDVSCVSNTCPRPTDLTATATSSSISLTWTDNTPGLGWDVEYGRAGFAHGMGTTTSTTVPSITISGLDATTTYDIYVRHICSATDTGGWAKATVTTEMCDNPNIIEIGDSSATVSEEYYVPVNNYFHYTLSETILLSEELEATTFSAISFNYAYTSPTTAKTDVDIYIQPTTKTSFSSSSDVEPLDPNNAVLVYSGALNCQQGWNVFGFDTPYTYDGSSNLMVIVDDNSDDYDGSSYKFYASATTDQMTLSYYSDSYDPDVTSPASFSGSKGVYSYRAQMQLISCNAGCSAPVIVSTQPSYNSVTLSWNGHATDYEISYMSVNDADFSAPVAISGNSYTLGGLVPATQYSVRLRSICDSGMVSSWASANFTTDSLPCFTPEALRVLSTGYNSVTLDWTPGGVEQHWVVKVFNSRIGEILDTVATHPAAITGLTANEAYFATVQAACGSTLDGFSDWSDTISFTTSECVAVSNIRCAAPTNTYVELSWTSNGSENAWVVAYGVPGFGQGEEIGRVVATTNPYQLSLAGLDPNTTYEVYVSAQCVEGLTSIPAGPATFTTNDIGIFNNVDLNLDLNLYPNPTTGTTTISVNGISGKVNVAIVDMNGREVMSSAMECDGDCEKVMNVEGLAQGAYFVRIYGEEINSIRKLIVR